MNVKPLNQNSLLSYAIYFKFSKLNCLHIIHSPTRSVSMCIKLLNIYVKNIYRKIIRHLKICS